MTIRVSKLGRQLAMRRDDGHAATDRVVRTPRETPRPLHKREIDRRLEDVAAEVAAGVLPPGGTQEPGRAPRPRWVDTKEFVERMRSFLVYN